MNKYGDFWAGDNGTLYHQKHYEIVDLAYKYREGFLQSMLPSSAESFLELGCGTGPNLRVLSKYFARVAGVEINDYAVAQCIAYGLDVVQHDITTPLPFDDGSFDIVATFGVLIHTSFADRANIMREMFRLSCKYILVSEYFAAQTIICELPHNICVYSDYGKAFVETLPLKVVKAGCMLDSAHPMYGSTFWLMEKI